MATVTTGFHRISNVTARAYYSTTQTVVPGAAIYVTQTSDGLEAVIYSDPGMTIQISGGLIFADPSGAYDYYIPLDYAVTEIISSPAGLLDIISNIVQNSGPLAAQTPVVNEIVTGSGTAFTLHNVPATGSVALYNGAARLRPGALPADYTISGANITMNYSLSTGALLADYRY